MQWEDFQDKQVALLGAGIENLALIPHLQKAGAHITVCNNNETPALAELANQEIEVTVGSAYLDGLGRYDYVFRIAGMPVAALEAALQKVEKRPIVTSPAGLFLALAPCHIIGVTGTKGKGTTSTMIGCILEAAGRKAVVVGNIGKPIFEVLGELTEETYAVVELSSFQLEDVRHSPEVAVVLPISEDHLRPLSETNPNYHLSMNDYVAAKAHITLYQKEDDLLVFAADNPDSTAIANVAKAKKIGVSQSAYQNHWNSDAQGNVFKGGEMFMNLSEIGLRGQHLFLNATFALAVASELGIKPEEMEAGLKNFQPLPHRLQDVGTYGGIRFVDDSYATAPDATEAALTAFTEPIILIAGGSTKGAGFARLAEKIADSTVKAVVLIGQEAPRIQLALKERLSELPIKDGGMSMEEAVGVARSLASEGDVVLLSPACASKDMFKDAADRGTQFQEAVRKVTNA